MDPLRSKNLISTKDASELSGYSSDYLSRLARAGKIAGAQVGRTWVVDEKSLLRFMAAQEKHKKELAVALARARASEYKLATKAETPALVAAALPVVTAPANEFITTRAASERSGYSADYLAKLAREGKIRGEQIGRQWFVHEGTLTAFIESADERKAEIARELARERVRDLHEASRPSFTALPFLRSRAVMTTMLLVIVFASAYGVPALFSPTSVGAAARASGAQNGFEEIALKTYTTLHSWFMEVRVRTFAYWKPSGRVIVVSMPGFGPTTFTQPAPQATTTAPIAAATTVDGVTKAYLSDRLVALRASLISELSGSSVTTINNNYFDIRRTSY
nr:helix-turn-helix domain-containing protein [Candidatus Paceibacterota bacterium]